MTTIFIDTNILLSPLKIENRLSFEELVLTLYPFKDSIVIPGHVYTEFYDNFESTFRNSRKIIESSREETCHSFNDIIRQLNMLNNNERFVIERQKRKIVSSIEDSINKRIELLVLDAKKLHDYLQDLFPKQTNDYYSIKERYVLMAEYDARCKRGVAPGYRDSGKDNENDYGDLYIWQEILDYMQERSKDDYYDAVFVTNDCKADWRGERSENQLQVEYGEYVFDGIFSVKSFCEFKQANEQKIASFRTKYRKLTKLIEKESWSKDEFTAFMGLIKAMDLSLTFFLIMLSEESKVILNRLIQPFKSDVLQLDVGFLSLSPRGQNVLRNAGCYSIQTLMSYSITEMIKLRCFGKMSLSEISEKRVAFNALFGPFVSKLETYTFDGYTSRRKRVSFDKDTDMLITKIAGKNDGY